MSFSDFTLSPHNFDVTADGWVHLGHYHGGTRFLRIATSDWSLTEKGYFRAAKDVPEDSKAAGINDAAPFTWCAVEHEGVVYASDINTGVYALRYKPSSSMSGVGTLGGAAVGGGLLYRYADRIGELVPMHGPSVGETPGDGTTDDADAAPTDDQRGSTRGETDDARSTRSRR